MVLGNIFSVLSGPPKRNSPPRWNVPFVSTAAESIFGSGNTHVKKFLIDLYKTQPELNAVINSVCTDIAGKYHFVPVKEGESGRNKIQNAEKFSEDNQLGIVLLNQAIDWQMTGEGYSWMKSPSNEQIKEVLDNIMQRRYGLKSLKAKEASDIAFLKLIENKGMYADEDLMRPRMLRYVASSSMDIHFTDTDIDYYVQRIGSKPDNRYELNEIIRITDLMVDGKPYGFSPTSTLVPLLELLKFMWKNQRALQQNGGVMDKIFAFEDLKVESPTFKRMLETIQSYKPIEDKHGNMVMTGKLTVHDLNAMDGMQYKEVGLYILSVIAMHWRLPRSMLPFILGGTNAKSDIGGEAEKGYWTNIERKQDRLAQIYNTQLFIPRFGVKLVFNKEYKQDDLQENTALQLKLGNIEMTNRLLQNHKMKLNLNSTLNRLGIKEDELEEVTEDEIMQNTGMLRQGMPNQQQAMSSDAKNNYSDQKRTEQMKRNESRGTPSGV